MSASIPDELGTFTHQFNAILDYFDTLDQVKGTSLQYPAISPMSCARTRSNPRSRRKRC
jgi:Asp-tRNA(Asn)/Glu-tRNA(Gln) amidotransferase C subunit